jgi:hypothetical protein
MPCTGQRDITAAALMQAAPPHREPAQRPVPCPSTAAKESMVMLMASELHLHGEAAAAPVTPTRATGR